MIISIPAAPFANDAARAEEQTDQCQQTKQEFHFHILPLKTWISAKGVTMGRTVVELAYDPPTLIYVQVAWVNTRPLHRSNSDFWAGASKLLSGLLNVASLPRIVVGKERGDLREVFRPNYKVDANRSPSSPGDRKLSL